jgi:hypothetical protein
MPLVANRCKVFPFSSMESLEVKNHHPRYPQIKDAPAWLVFVLFFLSMILALDGSAMGWLVRPGLTEVANASRGLGWHDLEAVRRSDWILLFSACLWLGCGATLATFGTLIARKCLSVISDRL